MILRVVLIHTSRFNGLPRWNSCKESTCNAGVTDTQFPSLGWKDPLEEEMATHFSILA